MQDYDDYDDSDECKENCYCRNCKDSFNDNDKYDGCYHRCARCDNKFHSNVYSCCKEEEKKEHVRKCIRFDLDKEDFEKMDQETFIKWRELRNNYELEQKIKKEENEKKKAETIKQVEYLKLEIKIFIIKILRKVNSQKYGKENTEKYENMSLETLREMFNDRIEILNIFK